MPGRRFLLATASIAAAVLAVLAVVFGRHRAFGIDAWSERRDPIGAPWREIFRSLESIGTASVAGALVVSAILCFLLRRRIGGAILVALGATCSPASAELLKQIVGRRIHGRWLCFPSGHVAFATGLVLSIAVVVLGERDRRRASWVLPSVGLAAAVPMGWAMVALNAHYPTDAIGGAATAFTVVPVLAVLLRQTAPDRDRIPEDHASSCPAPQG